MGSLKIIILTSFIATGLNNTGNLIQRRSYSARAAEVTLFSFGTGTGISSSISGHSFIQIKNLYMDNVHIAGILTDYNESVTLGTWGNRDEHHGLRYNLESQLYYDDYLAFNGRYSISEYISSEELEDLSSFARSRDTWDVFNNCSSFAADCWNLFSDKKVDAGIVPTPLNLKNSISEYDYTVNAPINSTDFCGYMTSTGFIEVNIWKKIPYCF